MDIVADLIFPAFYTPYIAQYFVPVSAVAALLTEVVVYRLFNRSVTWLRIAIVVLLANLLSSAFGIGIAKILPSTPQWMQYDRLVVLGWIVAFLCSIGIEFPVIWLITRRRPFQRLFLSVCTANVASYAVLLFVLEASWGAVSPSHPRYRPSAQLRTASATRRDHYSEMGRCLVDASPQETSPQGIQKQPAKAE